MAYYVGARYVPQFANPYEWDINSTYAPLTIVGNQGNSYTSKKQVPAGIQISNEEYWALTSTQSGGIAELQEQVATNTNEIAALQDITDTLHDDVLTNTRNISSLQKITSVSGGRPTGLQNAIFLTDSMGRSPSWCSKVAAMWGLTTSQYSESVLSGSGFVHSTSKNTYVQEIDALSTSLSEQFKTSTTHIIVAGMGNDRLETSANILAAVASFAQKARAAFPNAKLYIGWITRNIGVNVPDYRISFESAISIFQQAAANNNMIWMHGVETAMYDLSFFDDNAHPNANGSTSIAQFINQAILSGSCWATTPINQPNTQTAFGNLKFSGVVTEYIKNGIYHLDILPTSTWATLTTPVTFTAGQSDVEIGTYTSPYATFIGRGLAGMWYMSFINTGSAITDMYDTGIGIYDNKILLTAKGFSGSMTQLTLPSMHFSGPIGLW